VSKNQVSRSSRPYELRPVMNWYEIDHETDR